MPEEVNSPPPKAVEAPSSADPTTAANARTNSDVKEFTTDTEFNSMSDLKEKAPEVYQKMMEGIAMNIISSMRRHADRLKKAWREMNERRY